MAVVIELCVFSSVHMLKLYYSTAATFGLHLFAIQLRSTINFMLNFFSYRNSRQIKKSALGTISCNFLRNNLRGLFSYCSHGISEVYDVFLFPHGFH